MLNKICVNLNFTTYVGSLISTQCIEQSKELGKEIRNRARSSKALSKWFNCTKHQLNLITFPTAQYKLTCLGISECYLLAVVYFEQPLGASHSKR